MKCPLTPPAESGRTAWRGPPENLIYFFNDIRNSIVPRGERLSVVRNTASGAYDIQISNITMGIDEGLFSCDVNTIPVQQYYVYLQFNGEYINLYKIDICT